jgi:gluconokinase
VVVVILGVSSAGKTTLGQLLAQELGWRFYEGDDFHSPSNIKKMQRGVPLSDDDRKPWLGRLRELIEQCLSDNENAVLACSALKLNYRNRFRVSNEVKFVFLRGEFALIANQQRNRIGHFMNPGLLQSQFDALEEPQPDENVLIVELGRRPEEIVAEIEQRLELKT